MTVKDIKKKERYLEKKPKIVLITGWWSEKNKSIVKTSSRLINNIIPLSDTITCIFTNHSIEKFIEINFIEIKCKRDGVSPFLMAVLYLLHQLKISFEVLKLICLSKVDIFIFAFGADSLIFPILIGRFFGKKIVLRIEGRNSTVSKEFNKRIVFHIIESLAFRMAHRIAIEYDSMVERYSLQKYRHKISVWGLYIDESFFKENQKLSDRSYQIGYIGRLSEEKGVLEFAQSLNLLINNKKIKGIIIGSGNLKDKIKEILINNNIQNNVNLVEWIRNEDLPQYLNRIQIVAVPSYREGLPNILLESMACGCVILATPVGGIPDIIKDEDTGFIMENNSPECISKNFIRIQKYPNLNGIVQNARKIVERKYNYEAAMQRYRNILEELS